MPKSNIKHFIIIFLLVCLTSFSTFASSISSSNANTLMSSSLDSLSNIQKQLETISRNLYVSTSDNNNNNNNNDDDSLKRLAIYSDQLSTIIKELESIPGSSLDKSQVDIHRALLTATRFLDYIALKISSLAQTNDQFERYDILNTIGVTNTLVEIMLANITVPQS